VCLIRLPQADAAVVEVAADAVAVVAVAERQRMKWAGLQHARLAHALTDNKRDVRLET
jgi:hypothetical protein